MTIPKIFDLYRKKTSVLGTMRSDRLNRYVGQHIMNTAGKKQPARRFQRKIKIFETNIPGTRQGLLQVRI